MSWPAPWASTRVAVGLPLGRCQAPETVPPSQSKVVDEIAKEVTGASQPVTAERSP